MQPPGNGPQDSGGDHMDIAPDQDQSWGHWLEELPETVGRLWLDKYFEYTHQQEEEMLEDQIRCLKAAVGVGHAVGQYHLGLFYRRGKGVPRSYSKAAELFAKAAALDENNRFSYVIPMAQEQLAMCYHLGQGVEQSSTKAVELWTKAADKNNADALVNLGSAYANGQGVAQSHSKAVEQWTKAADQNHTNELLNLGTSYAQGRGVEQSWTKAVELWTKAVALGSKGSYYNLGVA